jgi:photosystem II stability/assembly factor-like uncharacterized protein
MTSSAAAASDPASSATNSATGATEAAEVATWQRQSPLPAGATLYSVDMISALEGWAVGDDDPMHVVQGITNGTILHTTDGGTTWTRQNSGINEPLNAVDFLDATHGWAVGNNDALYTTNGGQTWSAGTGLVGSFYNVEFATPQNGFATGNGTGYFHTTDGGHTWQWVQMGGATIGRIQFFDASNGVANSPDGVYHTSNGGNTWSLTSGHGGSFFLNPNLGWYVQNDVSERTTDGGATWQAGTLPAGAWIYTTVFTSANDGWAAGSNNLVLHTTDGGMTWATQFGANPYPYYYPIWSIDFGDATHGVAVGNGGFILNTANTGTSWDVRLNGAASYVNDLKMLDADHLWTSNNSGEVSWTTDGGNRWNLARVDNFTNNNQMRAIDFIDTQNGWTGGGFGSLHQSTDGGRTWVTRDAGTAQQIFGVDVVTPQTIVIVGGGTSFTMARRSTDGGASWQEMQVHIPDTLFLDVFFVNETTGWIVGSSGGISKTTDAGATWTGQPHVGSWGFVSVNFSDPNNGWAGGYFADLYHTTNGGATWTQQNPAIPDRTHVLGVSAISANVAWISGYGGGANSLPYVKHTTNGGVSWVEDTPVVGPYAGFGPISFLDAENGWAAGAAGIFRRSNGIQPTSTPASTSTSTPVATQTASPTSTLTPVSTATSSSTATSTTVPTVSATPTSSTSTATRTMVPSTATSTTMPDVSATPTGSTSTATQTAVATATTAPEATATATACSIVFTDVPAGSTFYPYIECLACKGILTGYQDGTFKPSSDITRGQAAKILANSVGYDDIVPPTQQTFQDVPVGSTFWVYVERAVLHGAFSGYPCGGPGEPCPGIYFRPDNSITRGQLAKVDAISAGYADSIPSTQQTFSDVASDSTFWVYIERVALHGIVNGYADGTFRPGNNITRGQAAKVASLTFFPECAP